MQFQIDKRKKKLLSRRAVTETIGGKIALGVSITLIVGAFVLPPLIMIFFEGFSSAGPIIEAILVFVLCLIMGIVSLACTWMQRTAKVSLRKLEHLELDGSLLRYSFAIVHDKNSLRRNVIYIDFSRDVTVTFDRIKQKLIFDGDVYDWYYSDIQNDRIRTIDEMNRQVDSFDIGNYFIPELDAALRDHIERVI